MPPIDVGVWLRVSNRFQGTNPKKLNDQAFDSVYAELHLSGKVHEKVGYVLNLNANGLGARAGVEDLLVSFDLADEFHIWAGQTLVPVDRTNFSGPFFIIPWNYPGVYSVGQNTAIVTPVEPYAGRDVGATVWGDFKEGLFKYYLGVYNLSGEARGERPLYSGRLSLGLIGKDPGLWGSSTFYGEKNVLALGVGAQYEKDGRVEALPPGSTEKPRTDDFWEINADVLAEFKVGEGAVTGEAAYYHFGGDYVNVNRNGPNPAKDAFFLLGAYLTPPVGPGRLQPMVRYQTAMGDNDLKMWMLDAGLAYVVKGPQLRVLANFQHTDMDKDLGSGRIGNALQLAVQTIMF